MKTAKNEENMGSNRGRGPTNGHQIGGEYWGKRQGTKKVTKRYLRARGGLAHMTVNFRTRKGSGGGENRKRNVKLQSQKVLN